MLFSEEGEEFIVRVMSGPTTGLYLVRVENGVAVAYNAHDVDGCDDNAIPDYSAPIGRFDGRRILLFTAEPLPAVLESTEPMALLESTRPTAVLESTRPMAVLESRPAKMTENVVSK